MTKKVMKSIARSLSKALRAKGHAVPNSVLLHALAASYGETDWHVLCVKSAGRSATTVPVNVRGALRSCIDMLQECLRHADKDTADTINAVLIEAQAALDKTAADVTPSARLIETARLVVNRWERGDLAEAVRMLDRALKDLGKEAAPVDSIFQRLLKAAEDVLEANGGMPPDWMQDEAVALAEVIEEARSVTSGRVTDPPEDYWGSDEEFPVKDWQYEVENGDTRLGYWEWVASKRNQSGFDRDDEDTGGAGDSASAKSEDSGENHCTCNVDPVTGKNYGVNPHCREHGDHRCVCANCESVWDIDELNPIKDYELRVEEGEEEPEGECPQCGALCYCSVP